MKTKLSWERPKSVAQWDWSARGLPFLRYCLMLELKWSLILGAPALALMIWLGPSHALRAYFVLAAGCLLLPATLFLTPLIVRRYATRYEVGERGFVHNGTRYRWNRLESCVVTDHPVIHGMRVVELRIVGRRIPRKLEFDPAVVDESAILGVLNQHVNAKVLLRPAAATEEETLLRATCETDTSRETLGRPVEKG